MIEKETARQKLVRSALPMPIEMSPCEERKDNQQ